MQAHPWLSSRLEAGIEGDEVEWIVDEIVNESFGAVAGALGTWRELVEDPPRIVRPVYTWGERRGRVPGQAKKTWRRDSLTVDGSRLIESFFDTLEHVPKVQLLYSTARYAAERRNLDRTREDIRVIKMDIEPLGALPDLSEGNDKGGARCWATERRGLAAKRGGRTAKGSDS